jgi:AcrR family transcriptional regulator
VYRKSRYTFGSLGDMPEQRTGRPPDPRTRAAALRAARDLVLARGYEGVTMSDIAATAGIPRPSLYRRWASKQALVADCILDDVLPFELLVVDATGDLRADLRAWIARSAAAIGTEDTAALFRALLAAAASDEAASRRMSAQFVGPLRSALRDAFRAAGATGDEVAADALIGAMLGAIVTRDAAALRRLRDLADVFAG